MCGGGTRITNRILTIAYFKEEKELKTYFVGRTDTDSSHNTVCTGTMMNRSPKNKLKPIYNQP